jgi:phosphoglycerol transferase
MLESMETSYQDTSLGGALPYNLIPELTQLAQNNINFSNNDTVGGFREVTGASWTVGAMVAHTSGVPLKVPDGISDWQNGYGKDGEFLPGLGSLTQILKQQGYYQTLMVGSDANFGGRKTYFETHGIDKVYDLYTAWYDGTVNTGYWNDWWGFEDHILFDYARKELTEIAQKDQPFAFTMLTVDTHHIGGFTCSKCGSTYEESYENAIACASKQVAEFVAWIREQPFYENTTVIITGDHCSMDKGYFSRNVEGNYTRHVYNCFINAAAQATYTKNRQFSAMDMFPTTLAAMGCTIEGDRLGLGTNLFSNQPTLMERFGYDRLCKELSKKSEYYADRFYGEIDYSTTPTE